jgi:hypothetical protein
MEIKHQVFVSSTYQDLIEERQHVIHALLELDCIPAGMELFPATDEDAWTLIKEIIDSCDYYILILAGKYGSVNKGGIGYTEMEFDYAVSANKPIIAFIYENAGNLPSSKTEKTEEKQKKLAEFIEKAKAKHCKFWNNAQDLGGKVSRSLVQLKKKHPSDGWVPGKYALTEKMLTNMEEMRQRIAELESEKNAVINTPPPDTENLKQGTDLYPIESQLFHTEDNKAKDRRIEASWDDIFSYVGAALQGEGTEQEMKDKIRLVYYHKISSDQALKKNTFDSIVLRHAAFDRIKIQLQALGLITPGIKKRAVSDTNIYWKLTPYGEKYLIKIRALRRTK